MPSPVAFFHWLQVTWLAPKHEAAGFVFLNERAHTFSFATQLALHRYEQTSLHLPPPCQPTSWSKHKEDFHCELYTREHKRRQSGHYSQESTGWAGFPFALQLKRCVQHFQIAFYLLPCLSYKVIMNPHLGSIRLIALGKFEPDQSGSYGQLNL